MSWYLLVAIAILLMGFGVSCLVWAALVWTEHQHQDQESGSLNDVYMADLLSTANQLQADSLEARKALIRESFAVMGYDGCTASNGQSPNAAPIEPNYYEWN